jgi:hypothetical protein
MQMIYEYKRTSEYHIIDILELRDQMIYSSTQKLLTECNCDEFYVEPNEEDWKNPLFFCPQ